MQPILICTAIAGMLAATANAQNANVTWQTPTTISGTSDVSLDGTFFASWAPGDDWGGASRADNYPVNDVIFGAYGLGANFGFSGANLNLDRYNGFANPNTADANYNYLMQTSVFNWNQTPMTISWDSMTVGTTYEIELWLNDGRDGHSQTSTFTGGANNSAPVAIGQGVSGGGPGQFIIGTFTADSTTENLVMSPGYQLTLMEVRTVPEPSTLAFFAAGTGALLLRFRRKNRV